MPGTPAAWPAPEQMGFFNRLRQLTVTLAANRWTPIGLAGLSLVVYLVLGPDQAGTDSHLPIAQAFLQGRLYITGDYPWLELVPRTGGGWYSPFPPLVSVFMLPFAAVGFAIDTNVFTAFAGALTVWLMWQLLGRLRTDPVVRLLLVVAWAFGSEFFWIAATGGQHLAPQVVAAALLIGALILSLDHRSPVLAGLLIGLAVAARLPVGLALPMILWLQRGNGGWWRVLVGAAIPLAALGAYNFARFGNPLEFGYGLIVNDQGESVLTEPWYTNGIDSITYLPRGIFTMLFAGFTNQDDFPWIKADIGGASILLTMPILLWIFEARGQLALAAGLTAVLIMLPDLAHGNPGFAQMGYRFILDALPLLWLMLGIAFREGIGRAATLVLLAGIPINLWFSWWSWVDLASS